MRLSCSIATRILTGRTAGERSPAWVAKHISRCDKCRSEAAAQARLQSVLIDGCTGGEKLSLTWRELRANLPERELRPLGLVPAFGWTAVAAAMVAVICIGLSMHSRGNMTEVAVKHAPPAKPVLTQPHPIVAENTPPADQLAIHTVKTGSVLKAPLLVRKAVPRAKPHVAPAPRVPVPLPRHDDLARMADNKPDAPSYTVVGAEEHVIDVVGVGSTGGPADSDTSYVIQTTDAGDDHQVVLL